MKKILLKTIAAFSFVVLFAGCASTYNSINPNNVIYTNNGDLNDGIVFSYRYNVLLEKGNKKYAKKEFKNAVKVVAVKITNHTDSPIQIGTDAVFYSGKHPIYPMYPIEVRQVLKQQTPIYLLYGLLTFLNLYVEVDGSVNTYPIGLVLGPAITGGNMIVSNNANKRFYSELERYDVIGKTIDKGETLYGLVSFRNYGYEEISLKLDRK